jgi:hypothetical protein
MKPHRESPSIKVKPAAADRATEAREAASPTPVWLVVSLSRVVALAVRVWSGYERLAARRPLAFSALTVALLMAAMFALFTPGYDTNDDPMMSLFVAGRGISTQPDEHLVFSNVVLGWLLKALYTAAPLFPWYGVYLYTVHFLGQMALLYAVMAQGYTRLRWRLYVFYFLVAELVLLNHLQFTTTAFIAGQGGLCLLLLAWWRRDWRLIQLLTAAAAGGALLLLASLIRGEVLYLVLLVGLPAAAWLLLTSRRPSRMALACTSGALVAAVALGWGLDRFHHAYYERDPQWRGFYAYNTLRSKFNDLAWVRYVPETEHVFRQVRWTKSDYDMLMAWFYDDQEVFGADTLEQILHSRPWQQERATASYCRYVYNALRGDRAVRAMAWLLPLMLLAAAGWGPRVAILLSVAAGAAVLAYLTLYVKPPPTRVYLPIFGFPLALSLLVSQSDPILSRIAPGGWSLQFSMLGDGWRRTVLVSPVVFAVTTAAILGALSHWKRQGQRSEQVAHAQAELREAIRVLGRYDNALIVKWASCFPFEAIGPFWSPNVLADYSFVSLGWPQQTPFHQRFKQRFGVHDLVEALCTRDDVLLLCDEDCLPKLANYVHDRHGWSISWRLLAETERFDLYQIQARSQVASPDRAPLHRR